MGTYRPNSKSTYNSKYLRGFVELISTVIIRVTSTLNLPVASRVRGTRSVLARFCTKVALSSRRGRG